MAELHRSGQGNIGPDHCAKKRVRAMSFTQFGEKLTFSPDKMTYMCQGPEICPSTNRLHWQGYVYWTNARTISSCAKQYKCTFLVARGSASENRIYCGAEAYNKNDKHKPPNPEFEEHGTLPKQGERSDLNALKEKIEQGESADSIAMQQPVLYHQYGRTLSKIEDICMRKRYRTEQTTCTWLWGETGVGKSHEAFKDFDPETHYVLPNDNGWWDGYCQQDIVIINDFRGNIPYNELLQLIDKWPHSVRRRGREPIPFISKHIYITSSLPPQEVYYNVMAKDHIAQLLRRCEVREVRRTLDN